jgi:hypothetical protein
MPALDVTMDIPDGDPGWAATMHSGPGEPASGEIVRIGVIRDGMQSGRPSLAMAVRLADGRMVFAETSWRNFALAAVALIARWGTP